MRSLVTGMPLRLWKPGPRLLLLLRLLPLCFFFSFLLLFCPIAIPPLPCLSQLLNAMLMPFLLPSASSSKSNPLPLPLLPPPKFLSALTHPPFSPSLSTIFILSLSPLGLLHEASSLFHNLRTLRPPGLQCPPVRAPPKGRHQCCPEKPFEQMLVRGLSPGVFTYTLLINARCRHPSNIPRALSLLEQMVGAESVLPNLYTYNAMMDGYCKAATPT